MDSTTPADLRIEFRRNVPPEVLGLLIQELTKPDPSIGAGPGVLDLVIAMGAASATPASVVVTMNGALDLAERLRRWREKCREKELPIRGELTQVTPGSSGVLQTDTPQ